MAQTPLVRFVVDLLDNLLYKKSTKKIEPMEQSEAAAFREIAVFIIISSSSRVLVDD